MRALQCFMFEFWDLETRAIEDQVADKASTEGLLGGWCVLMPEDSRICHLRRYAACSVRSVSGRPCMSCASGA